MENVLKSNTSLISTTNKSFVGGIITGQIAGLIMAVVVMIVFTLLGKGPLYPVQVIGSAVFGESALQGLNINAIFAGLVLHQAGPSLLWGFVFGLIAKNTNIDSTKKSLSIGLTIGVISMVGPYFLIPAIMNMLHGVDIWNREVPMFWDWAAHIVFGASFALYPVVMKKLDK